MCTQPTCAAYEEKESKSQISPSISNSFRDLSASTNNGYKNYILIDYNLKQGRTL